MGEEGGLQTGNHLDPRACHIQLVHGLGLAQHVDHRVFGQRVERDVNLLDVDQNIGIVGDVADGVVGDLQ